MLQKVGKPRLLLGVVSVLACAAHPAKLAQAQDTVRVMTLEQAVALAVETDPAAVAALGAQTTAQAEVRQARASFLPTLSLNSTYSNSSNERFDQATGRLVSENYTAQLGASYELFSGGRRIADQRSASADLRAATARSRAQRFETVLQTQREFYAAAAAAELVSSAEQRLERARQQLTFAQTRLEVGSATRSDLLRAELEVGNAELAVVDALSNQRSTRLRLGRLVGLDDEVQPAPGSLPDAAPRMPSVETLAAQAERISPAAVAARSTLQARNAERWAAYTSYLPSIRATGGYDWFSFNFPPSEQSWSFRLIASIPLFNGLQRETNIARARVAEQLAQAEARDAAIGARIAAEDAAREIAAAERRVQIAGRAVELAQEDLRVQEERYQLGNVTILELQTSQVTLAEAQAGWVRARIFVRPPSLRGLRTNRNGADVSVAVQGDDLLELQRIAEEVSLRVRDVPGLENLEPSTEDASPQVAVRLDRERASYLGLNVAAVGQTLHTALDGSVASRFTEGNKEYDIRVMFPRERFTSPENLGSVALFPGGGGGSPIYVRDVADVYSTLGPTTIVRDNQNRILRLSGDVNDGQASVGQVNAEIRARLADLELPEGYALLYGGEEEAIREHNRQLTIVVLLAIFLVFVVMAVQYESVINPLVILLAIPLSLIGVCVALWITQTPLSAPVLLGVILLAGIVVNNAILLVEYVEQFRKEGGVSMEDAVIEAGAVRLRPILMTTLTTVLGMLPLAFGIGEGSEMMQPLAIAVVGGLSVSTFLTLFMVPSTYILMHQTGDRLKHWLTGRRHEGERHLVESPAVGD